MQMIGVAGLQDQMLVAAWLRAPGQAPLPSRESVVRHRCRWAKASDSASALSRQAAIFVVKEEEQWRLQTLVTAGAAMEAGTERRGPWRTPEV